MASVNVNGQAASKATGKNVDKGDIFSMIDNSQNIRKRFEEALGKNSGSFLVSLTNILRSNKMLAACSPMSILGSALKAAVLDLPIEPSLGFAAIVPYKNEAQFQIMSKGFIQLAQRSNQYQTINVSPVYSDEFIGYNPIFEKLDIAIQQGGFRDQGRDDKIVGYVAYFKLSSGFEKMDYWSIEKIERHGQKFSKSYHNSVSPWKTNREAMCAKTVLKNLVAKWGPLSVDVKMQQAIISDQGVINYSEADSGEVIIYPDNPEVVNQEAENEVL